jgi:tetratricopeptide (TPR) repeat protein
MRILLWLGLMGVAFAAEGPPDVKAVILPKVAQAKPVQLGAVPDGITMAISSSDETAQKHVLQGLNLIHGGWDFEAYRHFVAALQLDPDCLMAHFGVIFSLAETESEFIGARVAAAERAIALVQAGAGTEIERGYIFATMRYLDDGPSAAADAFAQVSQRYPQDMQLQLFETYFRRSGFDEYGSPKPEQEVAEEKVQALMKKQPDSTMLMNAWLVMRAEKLQLEKDLPMARKLCQMVPDYAPYLHLLGHYEWRCGNHSEAAEAFSRCGDLYQAWMKNYGFGIADCPEWIRAEAYRAVSLASSGDYDSALAAAHALAKVPIPEDRLQSPGARMMWWEANTLEARLLMRRAEKGDFARAKASLPPRELVQKMAKHSKVAFFYQGLAMTLEGQIALADKNAAHADEMQQALAMHLPLMEQVRGDVIKLGELTMFSRAFSFLEIAMLGYKGDLAMSKADAKSTTAYNWYSGARERQILASRLMPPSSLLPMNVPLGKYYESKGNFERAKEMYEEGLQYWPRDLCLLEAMQKMQVASKDEAGAKATAELIKAVRKEN